MGRVETAGAARAARGCIANSAYKMDVLMSWDIDAQDPSRSKTAHGAARESSSSDCRGGLGQQIEISNGLLLHEVISQRVGRVCL